MIWESLDWKDSGFAQAGCVLNASFECLPMTRGIKAASLRSEGFYSNKKHIRGIFRPWLRCDKLTESLWNLWSELKQQVQLFVWICKITLKHSRVLHLCGFLPLKHYCIVIFSGRVQGVRGGRGHRRIHFYPLVPASTPGRGRWYLHVSCVTLLNVDI